MVAMQMAFHLSDNFQSYSVLHCKRFLKNRENIVKISRFLLSHGMV